jgi:AhpD family alkylhydroperoxidase
MHARMRNPVQLVPAAAAAIGALMQALQHDVEEGIVPAATLMLAAMRGSQVNGGSACLYADTAAARKAGVTEAAARMNDRSGDAIPDPVWDELVTHYDERQRATLILWVATSSFFNTINNVIQDPAGTTWD